MRNFWRFTTVGLLLGIVLSAPTRHTRTIPLFGNATLGYYFVNIYVGESMSRQSLIVDTGSSLTTFPCSECKECGTHHYNQPYRVDTSPAFQWQTSQSPNSFGWKCQDKCEYSVSYVELSGYSGRYFRDYVVFFDELARFQAEKDSQAKEKRYEAIVGCSLSERGEVSQQEADGLLGLGLGTNTTSYAPDLVQLAAVQQRSQSPSFSLCFGHDGGYMTIGEYDDKLHHPDSRMEIFKFDKTQGQYKIKLNRLKVDEFNLPLTKETLNAGQGVFIDSGTTLIYGPQNIIDPLIAQIEQICKEKKQGRTCGNTNGYEPGSNRCYNYSPTQDFPTLEDFFESFPHVYMVFEPNAYIPLYPRDYFFLENGMWCLGFDYLDSRIILGGVFMRNYDIQFDREAELVYMMRSDCSPKPGFDFVSYYLHHSDDRGISQETEGQMLQTTSSNFPRKKVGEKDQAELSPTAKLLVILVAVGLGLTGLCYSIIGRRYTGRSVEGVEMEQTNTAFEL